MVIVIKEKYMVNCCTCHFLITYNEKKQIKRNRYKSKSNHENNDKYDKDGIEKSVQLSIFHFE